ncbi:MAG: SpoIIE family protein phosphatase [Endomicrobium sp.]|jgi:sigma-B regulation protein RsbU (phosphoserine phosphatase)|nr:SpoIIE family protein phosphatase [Endomicrobium sp.]
MKSLSFRFFLVFSVYIAAITVLIGWVAFSQSNRDVEAAVNRYMSYAASLVEREKPVLKDPDLLMFGGTRHSGIYRETADYFKNVADSFNFRYVYLLKEEDGKFIFVLSSEEDSADSAEELFPVYGNAPAELTKAFEKKESVIIGRVYSDQYGSFISMFYPIMKDGEVVSVLGIDYKAGYLRGANKFSETMTVFLIAMMILTFPVSFAVSRRMVNRIRKLNDVIWRISEGDFNGKVAVRGNDEIARLGKSFNKMIDNLRQHVGNLQLVTAEKERMNNELSIASNMQSDMLPKVFPKFALNEYVLIHAKMKSAKETSGDLYDFFYLDEQKTKIVFIIADVSGKGVPAALFMVIAKMLIKQQMLQFDDPAQALLNVNKILCEENPQNMFITAVICSLDLITGKMTYANAGHNAPLVSIEGESYEFLKLEKGRPMGLFQDSAYENSLVRFKYGSKLYLYTDGMNEAMNHDGKVFGNARFLETANQYIDLQPEYFDDAVRNEIFNFSQSEIPSDDMTSISILYIGKPKFEIDSFDDEIVLKTSVRELERLLSWTGVFMRNAGYGESLRNKINISVEEIFVNIARYAYGGETDENAVVRLVADKEKFVMRFEDGGKPFNLLEHSVKTGKSGDRKVGGLGIYITKKWMDEITYDRKDGKNIVTIYKFTRR